MSSDWRCSEGNQSGATNSYVKGTLIQLYFDVTGSKALQKNLFRKSWVEVFTATKNWVFFKKFSLKKLHCNVFPLCAQVFFRVDIFMHLHLTKNIVHVYHPCNFRKWYQNYTYKKTFLQFSPSFSLETGVGKSIVVPGQGFHALFVTLARHRRQLSTLTQWRKWKPRTESLSFDEATHDCLSRLGSLVVCCKTSETFSSTYWSYELPETNQSVFQFLSYGCGRWVLLGNGVFFISHGFLFYKAKSRFVNVFEFLFGFIKFLTDIKNRRNEMPFRFGNRKR